MPDAPYVLYASLMSYYSGKARSYLRKKGLAFEERLPNDLHFLNDVAPRVGGAYQPVLEAPDGTVVRDTTAIIDYIEALHPEPRAYPPGPKQRLIALIFELFGNEGMLKPAMHYRWAVPDDPSRHAAPDDYDGYISRWFVRFSDPRADEPAEVLARRRMQRIIDVILPGIGVTPETAPIIEAVFEEFLDHFNAHLQDHGYLFGGQPSVGDFGLIGPMYAHLGRDPYPSRVIKTRAPAVFDWIERMNAREAGLAMYPGAEPGFLPDDEIPETLLPILGLIARDLMPEVAGIVSFMNAHVVEQGAIPSGTPINPGGMVAIGTQHPIGHHTVPLRGMPVRQVVRYFTQWMFQRVLDQYAALDRKDRAEIEVLLGPTGLLPYLRLPIARRIERVNDVEVFA